MPRKRTSKNVQIKRAYDVPNRLDGKRVLIDRLWPRGVKKRDAKIDEWMKEIAPTAGLRKWFGHDPDRWSEFKRRYEEELEQHQDEIAHLREIARKGRLTLVFAARDETHNDAVVLKDIILQTRTTQ